MKHALSALFIIGTLFFSTSAQAGMLLFGKKDFIHSLAPTTINDAQGQQLFLGNRVNVQFFLLGVWPKDEGYVLSMKGVSNKYASLSPTQIQRMQAAGILPTPLPAYKLTLFDYLVGYSLWITLPTLLVMMRFKRKRLGHTLRR